LTFTPPNAPLRAVVFDLDGLMVNTEDLFELCGNELLAGRGYAMTDALRHQMIGRPALEALDRMIRHFELSDIAADLVIESETIMQRLMATDMATMPGLAGLLDRIEEANLPKAVATSSGSQYASGILDRFGIADHFRFVLTCEDVSRGKPDSEIYLAAAARLGVAPNQVMVLEDSANGCRAAVGAGAYTVAVPNVHTRAHSFDGVALVAESLEDDRILWALGLGGNDE
jgi:HAD superfamily hydrolase (TIGR01509 family)